MKKIYIILFCIFCIIKSSDANEYKHNRITYEQARQLVLAALTPEEKKWLPTFSILSPKDFGVSDEKIRDSRFVSYDVMSSVGQGSTELYDIDFYTGDIFSSVKECFEIKNKKLAVLQKKIRRTLNLSDAEYHKIKTKGLVCSE